MVNNFPRNLDPALIEIGDKIAVTLPRRKGLHQVVTGVVAERQDHGATRLYLTVEGGVLCSYRPGAHKPTVTLLGRAPAAQEPLAGLWPDALERVR